MMTNQIHIFKDNSGAYVASHNQRTICATWNREYADGALEYYIKSLNADEGNKIVGGWDK
jgi:hypothetical protein